MGKSYLWLTFLGVFLVSQDIYARGLHKNTNSPNVEVNLDVIDSIRGTKEYNPIQAEFEAIEKLPIDKDLEIKEAIRKQEIESQRRQSEAMIFESPENDKMLSNMLEEKLQDVEINTLPDTKNRQRFLGSKSAKKDESKGSLKNIFEGADEASLPEVLPWQQEEVLPWGQEEIEQAEPAQETKTKSNIFSIFKKIIPSKKEERVDLDELDSSLLITREDKQVFRSLGMVEEDDKMPEEILPWSRQEEKEKRTISSLIGKLNPFKGKGQEELADGSSETEILVFEDVLDGNNEEEEFAEENISIEENIALEDPFTENASADFAEKEPSKISKVGSFFKKIPNFFKVAKVKQPENSEPLEQDIASIVPESLPDGLEELPEVAKGAKAPVPNLKADKKYTFFDNNQMIILPNEVNKFEADFTPAPQLRSKITSRKIKPKQKLANIKPIPKPKKISNPEKILVSKKPEPKKIDSADIINLSSNVIKPEMKMVEVPDPLEFISQETKQKLVQKQVEAKNPNKKLVKNKPIVLEKKQLSSNERAKRFIDKINENRASNININNITKKIEEEKNKQIVDRLSKKLLSDNFKEPETSPILKEESPKVIEKIIVKKEEIKPKIAKKEIEPKEAAFSSLTKLLPFQNLGKKEDSVVLDKAKLDKKAEPKPEPKIVEVVKKEEDSLMSKALKKVGGNFFSNKQKEEKNIAKDLQLAEIKKEVKQEARPVEESLAAKMEEEIRAKIIEKLNKAKLAKATEQKIEPKIIEEKTEKITIAKIDEDLPLGLEVVKEEEQVIKKFEKPAKIVKPVKVASVAPAAKKVVKKVEIDPNLITIDFDKSAVLLKDVDKDKLRKLVEKISNEKGKRVKVVSYATGRDGQANSARRISLQRAIAIRSQMIKAGLDSIRINVQAIGDKAKISDSVQVFILDPES